MKLKLTQLGFETYNGQMGVIFFENGSSLDDVKLSDAIRMSAVMLCEWEDGTKPSIAQSLLDNAHTPAPTFVSGADGQHDIEKANGPALDVENADVTLYTSDSLGAIADEFGIKGLREIGDPLSIKGNSIKDLIDQILATGVKAK
jgi:hypothetical protein